MQYDKDKQEQMYAMVGSWKQSGLSQKAYCEQNNIRYYVFHYWYKRYRDELAGGDSPAFIPLDVNPAPSNAMCAGVELVLPDGKRILFHEPISSDFLKAVIP